MEGIAMSLDVYLRYPGVQNISGPRIFLREDGQTKEISREEWDRRFPDREPVVIECPSDETEVFSANITHNLGKMADAAGIYQALWRPEELGITKAGQLVPLLRAGLERLRADPAKFEKFNAPNGWGLYEHFVPWVTKYLQACEDYPDADVSVSR
jgi:hypothetical protein